MISYLYKRDKKRKMPDKLRTKVHVEAGEISWPVISNVSACNCESGRLYRINQEGR